MITQDQLFQARLIDRDDTLFQAFDLFFVDINGYDTVAALGKTGRSYQSDISGAKYTDLHAGKLLVFGRYVEKFFVSPCFS